jgi:RsiW-degrading membrane proteinase PrsW (M82 family)
MNTAIIATLVGTPLLTTTMAWFYYMEGEHPKNTMHAVIAAFLGFLAGLLCDAFIFGIFDEVLGLTSLTM